MNLLEVKESINNNKLYLDFNCDLNTSMKIIELLKSTGAKSEYNVESKMILKMAGLVNSFGGGICSEGLNENVRFSSELDKQACEKFMSQESDDSTLEYFVNKIKVYIENNINRIHNN